jgi:hypothetical protein
MSMQAYISYLLSDIEAAKRPPEEAPPESQSLEEHLAAVERWLESDPAHTLSYYCGLTTEVFPPTEKLTEAQRQDICNALLELLHTWNLDVHLPDDLPLEMAYPLMVSILDQKVDVMDSGTCTIEFCSYAPSGCIFGEHCMCKDLPEEEEDEQPPADGSLLSDDYPF